MDFRGKKPISFLLKVFELGGLMEKKDGIVLDFFAGSGSTGEAVLELNKRDGGCRQFILCTNNENNLCYDVTLPRLRNAIKGYATRAIQDEVLYEVKLTYNVLSKMDMIFSQIAKVEKQNRHRFDSHFENNNR